MRGEKKIRVLIVDDQKLFAESLQYVLEARTGDMEIIAVAKDGTEAVECARELGPDIILMDVRMPGLDGVQATKAILDFAPDTRIVMLSTFQDDDYVRSALRYGAVGYLVKNIAPEEVIKAIRAVHAGIVQISPAVTRALMKGDEIAQTNTIEDDLYIEPLTNREKDVLRLIMKSLENRQIAEFLNVTEQTAKNYVHNLYMKLGVSSRMQLLQLLQRSEIRNRLDLPQEFGSSTG